MVHDPLEAAGHPPVLGVILVGGASRRYGHDKAMAQLGGIPMVQRVAAQVAGQVSMLAASGTGRPGLDLAVIPDAVPHSGPLPALLSILSWAGGHKFELVATFSCDTPFLPSDLVMRLRRVLEPDRDCAVALHGGAAHPTCALWKVSALPKIQAAFDSGVRSLHGALAHLATCAADFSDSDAGPGDDPFFNINSPSDMAQAQAWIDRPVEGARTTHRMTRGQKMVDPFGRVVDYLRVSVTDRCNLRCTYCMSEDMRFLPKADLLSLEEIDRLCTLFIEKGVTHLRLTGGEPLMRRGIMKLVNNLSRHLDSGALQELTLTTNGVRLREFAAGLAAAGVRRVNVSLDSLDRGNFARIARGDRLPQVLDGIAAAQDAGLKVKINTVALKRDNAAELPHLVQWAHAGDMDITLIETMPLGEVEEDRTDQFLSLAEVRRDMESYWTLTELPERTGGPARYVHVAETGGRLGFITPLTHNFCETCRRMRVTCTGTLFMCLGQEAAVDLRAPLRGAGDGAVHEAIDRAVSAKPKSHDFLLPVRGAAPALGRHMSMTGG